MRTLLPGAPNTALVVDTKAVTISLLWESLFQSVHEKATVAEPPIVIVICIYLIHHRVGKITVMNLIGRMIFEIEINWTYKVFSSGLQPRPLESFCPRSELVKGKISG